MSFFCNTVQRNSNQQLTLYYYLFINLEESKINITGVETMSCVYWVHIFLILFTILTEKVQPMAVWRKSEIQNFATSKKRVNI